jgi:ABC-type antimicrobial peptide transport system permease subunit
VHFGPNPARFAPRLRTLIADIDPSFIVSEPRALHEVVASRRRQTTALIRGTGFLALFLIALAASAIYALMSFTVMQRRRELAIRSALGARRSAIMFTVARSSLAQLAGGSLLGGLFAWRILQKAEGSMGTVPGGSALRLALLLALGMLILVGVLACTTPVVRALRIMPAEVLREDA